MVSPRERSRSARRRIAGERSRLPGASRPTSGDGDGGAEPTSGESAAGSGRDTAAAPATQAAARSDTEQAPPADPPPAEALPATEPVDESRRERTEEAAGEPATEPPAEGPAARPALWPRRARPARTGAATGPPTWALAVLAVLLAGALALDGFVVWREYRQQQAEEAAARNLHSALIQAPSAAEKAATALLSFRQDQIDQDVAQARKFLTQGYAPKYIESIQMVGGQAADTGATVKAEVLSSGVVEASGKRSDVLLFVNQTTTSAAKDPQTALNRVVFTMVPRGDGWKVNEIKAF